MRRATAYLASVAAAALLVSGCSGTTPDRSSTAAPGTSGPSPTSAPSSASPTGTAPTHLVARTLRWRLPYPVAREAVVPDGSRVVLAGGLLTGDRSTDQVLSLDLATGRSRAEPSLPVPVHDTAGVLLGGRVLVLGGGNASEQDVVQARGPQGWSVAGHLPQPRSDLTALSLGSRAVVLGGYDATSVAVPTIVTSSDGVHWHRTGTLPVPVRYAAGVADASGAWLFGGERAGVMQRAVQRVDASGHARVVARLPVPLGHAVAVRLGDRILVAGGRLDQDTVTDRAWWFDPATHRFTPAPRLPAPLADSAVAVTDGGAVAYLVGGESPTPTDHVVRLTLR
ncbi:MAG: hypothetical protein ACXVW4_07915 [Nocardioides sp.]